MEESDPTNILCVENVQTVHWASWIQTKASQNITGTTSRMSVSRVLEHPIVSQCKKLQTEGFLACWGSLGSTGNIAEGIPATFDGKEARLWVFSWLMDSSTLLDSLDIDKRLVQAGCGSFAASQAYCDASQRDSSPSRTIVMFFRAVRHALESRLLPIGFTRLGPFLVSGDHSVLACRIFLSFAFNNLLVQCTHSQLSLCLLTPARLRKAQRYSPNQRLSVFVAPHGVEGFIVAAENNCKGSKLVNVHFRWREASVRLFPISSVYLSLSCDSKLDESIGASALFNSFASMDNAICNASSLQLLLDAAAPGGVIADTPPSLEQDTRKSPNDAFKKEQYEPVEMTVTPTAVEVDFSTDMDMDMTFNGMPSYTSNVGKLNLDEVADDDFDFFENKKPSTSGETPGTVGTLVGSSPAPGATSFHQALSPSAVNALATPTGYLSSPQAMLSPAKINDSVSAENSPAAVTANFTSPQYAAMDTQSPLGENTPGTPSRNHYPSRASIESFHYTDGDDSVGPANLRYRSEFELCAERVHLVPSPESLHDDVCNSMLVASDWTPFLITFHETGSDVVNPLAESHGRYGGSNKWSYSPTVDTADALNGTNDGSVSNLIEKVKRDYKSVFEPQSPLSDELFDRGVKQERVVCYSSDVLDQIHVPADPTLLQSLTWNNQSTLLTSPSLTSVKAWRHLLSRFRLSESNISSSQGSLSFPQTTSAVLDTVRHLLETLGRGSSDSQHVNQLRIFTFADFYEFQAAQSGFATYGTLQVRKRKRVADIVLDRSNEPKVVATKNNLNISLSPTCLRFWSCLQLQPFSGSKDVSWICIAFHQEEVNFPGEHGTIDIKAIMMQAVTKWIVSFSNLWQLSRLGIFAPFVSDYIGSHHGLVPLIVKQQNCTFPGKLERQAVIEVLTNRLLMFAESAEIFHFLNHNSRQSDNLCIFLFDPFVSAANGERSSVQDTFWSAAIASFYSKLFNAYKFDLSYIKDKIIFKVVLCTQGNISNLDLFDIPSSSRVFELYAECKTFLKHQRHKPSEGEPYLRDENDKQMYFGISAPLVTLDDGRTGKCVRFDTSSTKAARLLIEPDRVVVAMYSSVWNTDVDREEVIVCWSDHRAELYGHFIVANVSGSNEASISADVLSKVFETLIRCLGDGGFMYRLVFIKDSPQLIGETNAWMQVIDELPAISIKTSCIRSVSFCCLSTLSTLQYLPSSLDNSPNPSHFINKSIVGRDDENPPWLNMKLHSTVFGLSHLRPPLDTVEECFAYLPRSSAWLFKQGVSSIQLCLSQHVVLDDELPSGSMFQWEPQPKSNPIINSNSKLNAEVCNSDSVIVKDVLKILDGFFVVFVDPILN